MKIIDQDSYDILRHFDKTMNIPMIDINVYLKNES